jgi:hypothetical protein
MAVKYDYSPLDKMLQSIPRPDDDKAADAQRDILTDYRRFIEHEVDDIVATQPEVKFAPLLGANVNVEISSTSDPGDVALQSQRQRPNLLSRILAATRTLTRVDRAAPYRRAYRPRPTGPGGRPLLTADIVRQLIKDLGGIDLVRQEIQELGGVEEMLQRHARFRS